MRRVCYFRSRKFHQTHEAENLIRRESTRRNEARACRANSWTGHFAGVDAVAKSAGVLPHGADVEYAGEAEASEHVLKLTGKLGSGNVCDAGPLAFEKMDVAVPEAGDDRKAETIDDPGAFRKLHLRAATHGNDLFALDEDDAVADGIFSRADVDRGSDESGVFGWGVWRRAQKIFSWPAGASWIF